MTYVLIVPVDQSESEKSLTDGVTKVFTVKKIWPYHKSPSFRTELGLAVFLLETLPVAEGSSMLIIHINCADLPSNEP